MYLETGRVNVGPNARRFKQGDFAVTSSEILPHAGFEELHNRVKPELYSVGSILAESVIKHAQNLRTSRKPFGTISPTDPYWDERKINRQIPRTFDPRDLYSIHGPMSHTLDRSIETVLTDIENGRCEDYECEAYKRLGTLVTALKDSDPSGHHVNVTFSKGVRGFIETGTNFGAIVMAGLIDLIDIKTPTRNPSATAQIAKNTYPLVVKLASGEVHKVTKSILGLVVFDPAAPVNTRFDPRLFELKEDHRGQYLDINHPGREELAGLGLDIDDLDSENGYTVGCPAIVNLGDGSPIKMLWNWYTDILEEYETQKINKVLSEAARETGRNDPCPCGSGIKFKKCHLGR